MTKTAKTAALRPVWEDMSNPIVAAVAPLKEAARERAAKEAQKIVDHVTKKLEEAGWDAQVAAPYPRSFGASRRDYVEGKAKYTLYRAFVKHRQSSRSMKEPELVDICPERVAKFIEDSRTMAAPQYDSFVAKLVGKIGEVTRAELTGNHVWGFSFLTVAKADKTREVWKTQMIINISKLGNLFNQWPTRKVKKTDPLFSDESPLKKK